MSTPNSSVSGRMVFAVIGGSSSLWVYRFQGEEIILSVLTIENVKVGIIFGYVIKFFCVGFAAFHSGKYWKLFVFPI